ncbi:NARF domain-containing protein [Confluentibacter sediminis]|uniref:NARF domain-containing protein n=1 Tax=Confluentibacter sediminis TaxID=2219045 RepID=UPI000DAC0F5E|nr:NARF domain-containing protein [Confluentibacter sediminis]
MKIKNNLLTVIFFLSIGLNAQNKDSIKISDLENRVKYLEEYKGNVESVYKIELDNAIKAYQKDFDSQYGDLKSLLKIILFLGLSGGLFGAYLWFYGIKKKANEQINKRIEDIVEQKREDIIKLIQSQEFERKLKQTKSLLVISDNEFGQKEMKKIMTKFKFKNVIYRINKSYKNLPEHDLVIINNIDGEFKQKEVNKLLKEIDDEDVFFVIYTTERLENNPRLNFANSKFTLYNNIFTTLSFTETFKA